MLPVRKLLAEYRLVQKQTFSVGRIVSSTNVSIDLNMAFNIYKYFKNIIVKGVA